MRFFQSGSRRNSTAQGENGVSSCLGLVTYTFLYFAHHKTFFVENETVLEKKMSKAPKSRRKLLGALLCAWVCRKYKS